MCYGHHTYGYPEMIRHGYSSCVSCHVSPTGGGLVTTYGRSISKELLSRWSFEGEEEILHGAITNKSVVDSVNGSKDIGLNIGGNFRYAQIWQNTQNYNRGRRFPMQRDLDLAFKAKAVTGVVSYGAVYQPNLPDEVELRRLYLLWNVDDNHSVRFGRFVPNYGIMFSDHYTQIKQGLNLGFNNERNTLEVNSIFESWSANLNFAKSLDSKPKIQQEESVVAALNYNISETMRIGINYWFGDFMGAKRDITGINALLGFTKSFYALSEFDLQSRKVDDGNKTKGIFYFQRFGYEFTRGFHWISQIEGSQSDLDDNATKYFAYGSGFNIYPRPHFEIQFLWTRPKFEDQKTTDSGFLILHYYL